MALKAKVKKIEDVEEKFRDLYVKQDDGSYRLDAEGMETDDEVAGLKAALQRERELNKKKGDDGLTKAEKEELATLRQEREEAETKRLQNEKDWKGLEERLHKKYKEEGEKKDGAVKKANDRLFSTLKENAATRAISAAKGKIAPLLPHVMGNLDVIEEGDELKVVVKGKDGQIRYSKENPKEPMTPDDLIKSDFVNNEDFFGVFEGRGHSGSGASGGQGKHSGGTVTISRADAKDSSKYKAAKELAVKAGQGAPVVTD